MSCRLIILFSCCLALFSCSGRKVFGEENPGLKIHRFDQALYERLNGQRTAEDLASGYAGFIDIYGKDIIQVGGSDSTGFNERLNAFFAEPTLKGLYKDEQQAFADVSRMEEELSAAFTQLLTAFPSMKQPQLYMHVSGLNQNVVVTDEVLSLSADKYLGADYPLYQEFFYDYQRQLMTPDRVVPDYLLGFLMANLPFKGNEEVLLDRMLYEGKLRYIISQLIPDRQVWEYTGYNQEQYTWCSGNQARIWKTILDQKHLYTPNVLTTSKYLNEAPYTATLPADSPGRVGVWVGYQIICSFMKNKSETSLQELMDKTNGQELLKESKYKP